MSTHISLSLLCSPRKDFTPSCSKQHRDDLTKFLNLLNSMKGTHSVIPEGVLSPKKHLYSPTKTWLDSALLYPLCPGTFLPFFQLHHRKSLISRPLMQLRISACQVFLCQLFQESLLPLMMTAGSSILGLMRFTPITVARLSTLILLTLEFSCIS